MRAHLPALVFLFPFLVAVMMPLIGLLNRGLCRPLALASLAGMTLASLAAFLEALHGGPIHYAFSGWAPPVGIEWVVDGLSGLLGVVIGGIALGSVVFAGATTTQDLSKKVVPFYTLILLLVSALVGIVYAADLFNLFVFLEVGSLCSYALVGSSGGRGLVSAFRYLILGTIGASLYLLGVGYFYAATGTLNMADLADRLPALLHSKSVLTGLIFIVMGLAIKMALVPLHGWLPDAYTYAPDAISPLIAPLVTKVALYALVRIVFWVLGAGTVIGQIPVMIFLGWMGGLAAIVGAFLALSQEDLKRLFAYSGISHIGLIVLGISIGNRTGFAGGLFYLINDAVMQASLFFVAGAAFYRHGVRDLSDLFRLRGQMPWTVATLIVTALSMIGIPPTGGFFAKWYMVLGALEADNYLAVMVIVGATLLTLAYFVRVFERVFHEGGQPSDRPQLAEGPWAMRLSLGAFAATILALGLFSDRIIAVILQSALPHGL